MKVLSAAFAIACGLALILFGITFLILLPFSEFQNALDSALNVAKTMGSVIIASFPVIGEFIERQEGRKNLAAKTRNPIYDFRGFQIGWPLMVLYGTIIAVVVFELGGFIVGFIEGFYSAVVEIAYKADASKIQHDELRWSYVIVNFLVSIYGSYLVGRWVGARCARQGVVAIILIGAFASAIDIAINWSRVSPELSSIVQMFVGRACIFWAAGFLGFWRGHRQKLAKYLHYLLRVLPAETRETVIELAFEEAQKVGRAS
jgi:hypothetical protein